MAGAAGRLLLTGLGFLWSEVALTVTTASRLTVHTRGLGAGVVRTAAQLGGALGMGIIAVVISARTSAAGGSAAGGSALVSGLQAGLWCGAVFTAAASCSCSPASAATPTTGERPRAGVVAQIGLPWPQGFGVL